MKKHLLAAAVTAAFAVPAAAQVTVYGLIDAGYATSDISHGAGISTKQKMVGGIHSANGTGTLSGSRLGFRGEEDLGGGLKANFVYEIGINYSNGQASTTAPASGDAVLTNTTGMANVRQGYLGLSGGFGTVRVGQQDSITKVLTESMDPGAGSAITGAASLYQAGNPTTRPDVITYMSPVISGLQVMIQHEPGETTTSGATGKDHTMNSFGVTFTTGPIAVMASSESRKEVSYGANLVTTATGPVVLPAAATYTYDEVVHQSFGASYNLGSAKLFAMNSEVEFKDATAGSNGIIKTNLLGASLKAGQNLTLLGSVSKGNITDNGTETYDTSAYQLIARYDLSKRTNAYAAVGQTKFDSPTANSDVTIKQVGVGVRHSF